MSEKGKSHKAYPPESKSKCVREPLDGGETLSQAASRNGMAPSVLPKWRSQALENMGAAFGAEAGRRREAEAERARQELRRSSRETVDLLRPSALATSPPHGAPTASSS